jgi:myo-inositol 2-dehydrogenase/D-chiro-inositol 1-dehydrogenase
MVQFGKEFRSLMLARNPAYSYLPEKDRYLFALPSPKYRINIIGVGMMGLEHIQSTLLEGRAIITGVYDPNPRSIELLRQMAATRFPALKYTVHPTLEAACQDPNADALIISTPNYTHIEIIREAVKSGKHIFLEKPMATTIPDAFEIVQLAKNYPKVFQIGLQYRYKAMYSEAIYEALTRKTLGELKFLQILEHRVPFLDKVNQWNKFQEFSGGTLVEKCRHYFDLLNLFAQSRPLNVFASGTMAVNFKIFE